MLQFINAINVSNSLKTCKGILRFAKNKIVQRLKVNILIRNAFLVKVDKNLILKMSKKT